MTVSVAADAPRGGIAFHYATPLSPAELEWYGRFEVLVTHDPLPRAQVDALHARGTKVVLYEWAVAYYASLATPGHRTAPVLNRTPLRGHAGAADADAFYYDPAAREHAGRVEAIAKRLQAIGYDGVFLDTMTAESVHPAAITEYRRRHPDLSYDEAFADFLKGLAKAVEVVVTNQGYRAAKHVLPHVDWDVSESLITYPRNGRFVMRPWNDSGDRWNSIATIMKELIEPVRDAYPKVRFAHINYVETEERQAVADLVAISRLYDAGAVAARPDLARMIESDLLLLDLGKPRARVERVGGAYRFFAEGFIGYNGGSQPMRVPNREGWRYTDAVTGGGVSGKTLVLPPGRSIILRRAVPPPISPISPMRSISPTGQPHD